MSAEEILATRKRLGMTQQEFAEFLGVRKNTVWRWENGWTVTPPYPELIRLKTATAAVPV